MNIKRNIIFALESQKKGGVLIVENIPIRMRVNFASQRIEFTTGYRIDVATWDADKQRVKNGCTNKLKQSASEINAALLGYYTELQEVFKRFEVAKVMPSPADAKSAFDARHRSDDVQAEPTSDKADTSNDFYKAFDVFVRVCGRQNNWTHATYEKFAAVKNHLRSFRAGLSFSFFNEAGLTEYIRYLREVREMRNSTSGSNSAS
jgi:integrase